MLTDAKIRKAPSAPKPYKISDGKGLFLLVHPNGSKYWRLRYWIDGKEKLLAIGVYPYVSLSEAREKAFEAKKQVKNGADPCELKKQEKMASENKFEDIANEWFFTKSSGWAGSHAESVIGRLKLDVYPTFGQRNINEISAPDLLKMLRRIEERGAIETAHRVRNICSQIFRYAIATERAERDPAADLIDALKPYKKQHLAAITDPKELSGLLNAMDGYKGSHVVRCMLRLLPLLMVRPGEMRNMEWNEVDYDTATWTIPGEKMKGRVDHIVPLSRQAIIILEDLQDLTNNKKYAFAGNGKSKDKPISESTISAALERLGYKGRHTPHGFRATFRTIADEVLKVRVDHIEHQLAHGVKDPLGRSYNRTTFLSDRRAMLQLWADYLDGLKNPITQSTPLTPSETPPTPL